MTVNDFLEHHGLKENPFQAEEARSDAVFERMQGGRGLGGDHDAEGAVLFHSDFEKIVGDLGQLAPSVVFGEKGSGKTAIRLQIQRRVRDHNTKHPASKVLLVPYDDLNAILDHLHAASGESSEAASLRSMRLVDHIDAILRLSVPRLIDAALGGKSGDALELGPRPKRSLRKLSRGMKRDLLLLQALYDRETEADGRSTRLRRRLGVWPSAGMLAGAAAAWAIPVLLAAAGVYQQFFAPPSMREPWARWALAAAGGVYLVFLLKFFAWDRLANLAMARRVRKQLRVVSRGDASFARALRRLTPGAHEAPALPVDDLDERRYALLDRFRRLVGSFGYTGLLVVLDRVDEPTLVSGDTERMRAIVWPLLNNKFLQQPGLGVKMLLPMELRHALYKESSAFFQEARLDKQGMVERLSWTGAMLYDLCEARLNACLARGGAGERRPLISLFGEDVASQDVVDALDQMHQPRDAFKFLYRCVTEHCSNVTREQASWRIPKLVLTTVRKQEAERVQQMYRGLRPG